MEYIKQKEMPDIEAEKAYEQGFYIEAIQILHGFMENQAQSLLTLVGCVHFDSKQDEVYDLSDTLGFNAVLKVLFILNQISKEQFDKFNKLNSLRNKIVHQLYKEPYDKIYEGVPKHEYDHVFHGMLEELYVLTRKCEEVVG
ncbi:hypothetical protein GHNINEIG_01073 [Hydrogenovibrio crunogenus]|uniref:DUF86 domain-containing protein n=1 Tax=Hydrogenovibrio crunogenus TaxID=39765 RepID=A0A4P7P1C5_9GAMM|nr:hypothetical protein [Hydrogenovibrio crunogenus]QBZ83032.1 hypothetical protein GHNINEIG_01073 [Hydrogenovibrio crunogenus]